MHGVERRAIAAPLEKTKLQSRHARSIFLWGPALLVTLALSSARALRTQ